MKYRTIRKDYQNHQWSKAVFIDPYATLLSPFVTNVCLKLRLIPNEVTLCMICSGILGAAFFALPYLWAKIAGTILIHLWYILDCSDGEVARITKRFSRFGTEIDYAAHVINHPLFLFAFLLTLLQSRTGFQPLLLSFLFFGLVALNLVYRNVTMFRKDYDRRHQTAESSGKPEKTFHMNRWIVFFSNIFVQLPNFCLIFPFVWFISAKAAVWYVIVVLCFSAVFVPASLLGWMRRIVWE